MANPEHVEVVKQGIWQVSQWREAHPGERLDLREADLIGVDLSGVNLSGAILSGAKLFQADLTEADLSETDLRSADLGHTTLDTTNLSDSDLRDADLMDADLRWADLRGADLSGVTLGEVAFGNTDLSGAQGLGECNHRAPSALDHRTFTRSGGLPEAFMRGCGWPDVLIAAVPALLNDPIQFYNCFISHSTQDQDFAERLYADLQATGVRCWYAPQDLRIGDRFQDTIDQAVRLRDKLLVILSENSLASEWVEDEVQAAVAEERKGGKRRTVLCPLRIDNAVEETDLAWALRIKQTRHIGDFRGWKEHDAYQSAFDRLLRDLRADGEGLEI